MVILVSFSLAAGRASLDALPSLDMTTGHVTTKSHVSTFARVSSTLLAGSATTRHTRRSDAMYLSPSAAVPWLCRPWAVEGAAAAALAAALTAATRRGPGAQQLLVCVRDEGADVVVCCCHSTRRHTPRPSVREPDVAIRSAPASGR